MFFIDNGRSTSEHLTKNHRKTVVIGIDFQFIKETINGSFIFGK